MIQKFSKSTWQRARYQAGNTQRGRPGRFPLAVAVMEKEPPSGANEEGPSVWRASFSRLPPWPSLTDWIVFLCLGEVLCFSSSPKSDFELFYFPTSTGPQSASIAFFPTVSFIESSFHKPSLHLAPRHSPLSYSVPTNVVTG